MTAARLAKILDEEFGRDSWGYIDPYLFRHIHQPPGEPDDNDEAAAALRSVLERVAKRIEEGEGQ